MNLGGNRVMEFSHISVNYLRGRKVSSHRGVRSTTTDSRQGTMAGLDVFQSLLEEKRIGKHLHNLGFGAEFLDITPKA